MVLNDEEKRMLNGEFGDGTAEAMKLHVADLTFTGAVDGALLYQQHAKKTGINIKVVKDSADGFWNEVWMKKPWCYGRFR